MTPAIAPVRVTIPDGEAITMTIDGQTSDISTMAAPLIELGLRLPVTGTGDGATLTDLGDLVASDGVTFTRGGTDIPPLEALEALSRAIVHAVSSYATAVLDDAPDATA